MVEFSREEAERVLEIGKSNLHWFLVEAGCGGIAAALSMFSGLRNEGMLQILLLALSGWWFFYLGKNLLAAWSTWKAIKFLISQL